MIGRENGNQYQSDLQRIEQQDAEALKQAEVVFREEFGDEFEKNVALANGHLRSMPMKRARDLLSGETTGKPLLHDLNAIRGLVREARSAPAELVEAAKKAGIGELEQMRRWMTAPRGTPDYRKYWDSERVQARYRDLLRDEEKARGGST